MTVTSATTVYESGLDFWMSGSDTHLFLGQNKTLDNVVVSPHSTNFTEGSSWMNFSINSDANATLYMWNTTYGNMTTEGELNMTVGPLLNTSSRSYEVYQRSDGKVQDNLRLTGDLYLTFNVTGEDYTYYALGDILKQNCTEVMYSLFNGTYNYAKNQTFNFYCLPLQDECVPYKQSDTQHITNWTNTFGESKSLWVTLNATTRGYDMYLTLSNTYGTDYNLTTLDSQYLGTMADGAESKHWYFINTFYPFTDMYYWLTMEACDA